METDGIERLRDNLAKSIRQTYAYTGIMKYGQVPFQHTKQKSGMVAQFGLKKPTPICCLPRTGR